MIHHQCISVMYDVLWLMSVLMDCSFGHGEFAVDVFQVSSSFNSRIKKTISLLSTNDSKPSIRFPDA
jgi:hypothetical protein